MDSLLNITKKTRELYVKFLTETPIEKLVEIPRGFNNNIWWNVAHVALAAINLQMSCIDLPRLSCSTPNLTRKERKGFARSAIAVFRNSCG